MPSVNFLPFLQQIPFATRIITVSLVVFSLAALLLSMFAAQNTNGGIPSVNLPWLVMVPGTSYWYPWVLLTAGWVELSVIGLVISAVSLPLASRYLERVWGWKELIRFCFIVIIGSNVIAFGFSWLSYIILGTEDSLYGLPYHGQSGLQTGFLVAFTQLIPEHQIQVFGVVKMRVKTLPGIYLLISNVLVIVFGPSPYILVQFGFFVAWVYLRFFKLSENGEFRGDRSETFAFQYWFPPPIRPVISFGANFVFKQAVRIKLVQGWEDPVSGGYTSLPGPGGARAEAERRRAMALKALDARLASGSPAPTTSPATSTTATGTGPSTGGASTSPVASTAPLAPSLNKSMSSKAVPQVEDKPEKVKD